MYSGHNGGCHAWFGFSFRWALLRGVVGAPTEAAVAPTEDIIDLPVKAKDYDRRAPHRSTVFRSRLTF